MRRTFAIPTVGGKSCAHFGRCESFVIVDVDARVLGGSRVLIPPTHEPGSYPRFLADQGVDVVLTGGMGPRALDLFLQNGIEVHVGVAAEDPRILVERFLREGLQTGGNLCNHDEAPHGPGCQA